MAKFKLEKGAYRIDKKQRSELQEFLINKLKRSGKKTKTGNLSAKGLPPIFIDGVQQRFKDKGKKGWQLESKDRVYESVSGRGGQIRTNQNRYAGKLRDGFSKQFDELVGEGNTFTMRDKVYDKKTFVDEQVYRALKENKDIDVALKEAQDFFPGKSTVGHTDSVYGKYAVESPHAKYPESEAQNFADQGQTYEGKKQRIEDAGMATSPKKAAEIEVGLTERVGDPTSGETRNRIMRGEPPEQVKAQELAAKKKKYLTTDTEKALALTQTANKKYTTTKVINKTNGNGNGNGNGKLNGKNGKNGFSRKVNGIGARKIDSALNLALAVKSGNYGGAAVTGATLTAGELLKSKSGQKAVASQIAKIAAKRGGKSALKLIPGLDILISGKEAWDYAAQGKFDQAGIAALSGAIGWIPVIGDGASAALDLSNTGIDISRGALNLGDDTKPNKKRVRRTKL